MPLKQISVTPISYDVMKLMTVSEPKMSVSSLGCTATFNAEANEAES